MKGNFTSETEISLDISKVELSILEKESVKGLIKFIEDPSIIKNVKLGLGELEKNLYIELYSFPKPACFENISNYVVIISREGYDMLKEKYKLVDRTGGVSKVCINVRDYMH